MRKSLKALLCLLALLLALLPAAASAEVLTGRAAGMMGDVAVEVTVEDGKIMGVAVTEQNETPGIGSLAVEQLPEKIVEAQSADVDGVSGATVTSDAIKAAVAAALGGEETAEEFPTEADVIVVGAGAGGLSAAASAAAAGAKVVVLEANGRAGGSAILSGGNLNSLAPEVLEALGRNDKDVSVYLDYTADMFPAEYAADLEKVQSDVTAYLADESVTAAYDSVSRVMLDHHMKGYGKDLDGVEATMDYDYIREGVEANEAVYEWLLEDGITFAAPATKHYVTPNNKGAELIDVLLKKAQNAGATLVCNARAVKLLTDESGKVNGVVVSTADGDRVVTASKGVVLATGSFSANLEMFAAYQNNAPKLGIDTGSSNPPTNVGDGIVMAQALGAKLFDMQFVGFIWRGYRGLATTAEAGVLGAAKQLAVNEEGVRFTNDAGGNLQAPALMETSAIVNLVGDKAMADAIEASQSGLVADLEGRGVLFTGDTLEEAAEKAGLDPETLAQTVADFNAAVDAGADEAFGRTEFNGKVEEAPFVVAKAQALNHLTYGGLVTDRQTRVLREDGSAIPGLYAVGDVVSGFEGANHQTGECLTIVMHYGQVAGEQAAAN